MTARPSRGIGRLAFDFVQLRAQHVIDFDAASSAPLAARSTATRCALAERSVYQTELVVPDAHPPPGSFGSTVAPTVVPDSTAGKLVIACAFARASFGGAGVVVVVVVVVVVSAAAAMPGTRPSDATAATATAAMVVNALSARPRTRVERARSAMQHVT